MSKYVKTFIGAVLVLALAFRAAVSAAEPGTPDDPLASKSYVDKQIAEAMKPLVAQVEKVLGEYLNTKSPSADSSETKTINDTFRPVNVPNGQTLYGGQGAEVILRSGTGVVVTDTDSLVDITTGKDLANGDEVTKSHLIIIPRDDGRGVKATSDAWFLVKGAYEVK